MASRMLVFPFASHFLLKFSGAFSVTSRDNKVMLYADVLDIAVKVVLGYGDLLPEKFFAVTKKSHGIRVLVRDMGINDLI